MRLVRSAVPKDAYDRERGIHPVVSVDCTGGPGYHGPPRPGGVLPKAARLRVPRGRRTPWRRSARRKRSRLVGHPPPVRLASRRLPARATLTEIDLAARRGAPTIAPGPQRSDPARPPDAARARAPARRDSAVRPIARRTGATLGVRRPRRTPVLHLCRERL